MCRVLAVKNICGKQTLVFIHNLNSKALISGFVFVWLKTSEYLNQQNSFYSHLFIRWTEFCNSRSILGKSDILFFAVEELAVEV